MSPFYLYECPQCEAEFEEEHRMGEAPRMLPCPNCETPSKRMIAMPLVHYKARGFTGAGRPGGGRVDHFRHKDGTRLTESERNRKVEPGGS